MVGGGCVRVWSGGQYRDESVRSAVSTQGMVGGHTGRGVGLEPADLESLLKVIALHCTDDVLYNHWL